MNASPHNPKETGHLTKKGWALAGGTALLSLLVFLSSSFLSRSQDGPLVAATGSTIHSASPVRVRQEENKPRAFIEALRPEERQIAAESCLSKEELDRYYNGNVSEYKRSLQSKATCMSGYMTATVLDGKIANANQSLNLINNLLDLLHKTQEKLNKAKTVDGLGLIGIPAGKDTLTSIESAKGITMKCLVRPDDTKEASVAVGTADYMADKVFLQDTKRAKAVIDKIKKDSKALADEVSKEIEKNTGKSDSLGKAFLIGMVHKVLGMKNELKSKLIPIDAEFLDFEIKHGLLKSGHAIAIGVSLNGQSGKEMGMPGWVESFLDGFPFYINGPFNGGGIVMGDENENFPYENIVIPEEYMLNDFKKAIAERIKELEAKKKEFEAIRTRVQKQLADLEAKNFGCNTP